MTTLAPAFGQALPILDTSKEDEERLRAVAFSKPKWRLAAHCITIMLSTTMGFGELRQLRRRDVDMKRQCITVREGAKNEARERTIPLNVTALESMTWILERWEQLGGNRPEQYILPHHARRTAQEKAQPGHAGAGPEISGSIGMF